MVDEVKPAIKVNGITKTFKIPFDKTRSVKSKLLGKSKGGYREFTPLNDVSFTVNKGDFFGIVGRNGSGKSTLLKTIAGIYSPTKGSVSFDGKLVPFIELGVGFNPLLSGKDNVYLNGALLGFSHKEIDAMYDDIVSFAELEDFMDERLQNYSSGMQVRLAFSISIRARGDILLLDEVLAVGDAAFQQKCFDYFEELKNENKTVILVTHSMANVERFCNRGLLLDEGVISHIGTSEEISERYMKLFSNKKGSSDTPESLDAASNKSISIKSVEISQAGKKTHNVEALKKFTVTVKAKFNEAELEYTNFSLSIRDKNGNLLIACDTSSNKRLQASNKKDLITISFDIENYLTNGSYAVGFEVLSTRNSGEKNEQRVAVYKNSQITTVQISGIKKRRHSLMHPPINVHVDIQNRNTGKN